MKRPQIVAPASIDGRQVAITVLTALCRAEIAAAEQVVQHSSKAAALIADGHTAKAASLIQSIGELSHVDD